MRQRRRCDGKGGGERRDMKGIVFVCRLCYVFTMLIFFKQWSMALHCSSIVLYE